MLDIDELTEEQAKEELKKIAEEIAKADNAYYQNDEPYLTDSQYDTLKHYNTAIENRFPQLIRSDSPSRRVGAPIKSNFGKITHNIPMLSLSDVFSLEEVEDFFESIRRFLNANQDIALMCEPKIDGLSFSARYENGVFVQAATRGDGSEGEDITQNLKTISQLPLKINGNVPEILEIRGEVYMSKNDFLALNQNYESEGNCHLFSNSDNS